MGVSTCSSSFALEKLGWKVPGGEKKTGGASEPVSERERIFPLLSSFMSPLSPGLLLSMLIPFSIIFSSSSTQLEHPPDSRPSSSLAFSARPFRKRSPFPPKRISLFSSRSEPPPLSLTTLYLLLRKFDCWPQTLIKSSISSRRERRPRRALTSSAKQEERSLGQSLLSG